MTVQPIEIPPFKNLSPGSAVVLSYDDALTINNWVSEMLESAASLHLRWIGAVEEKAKLEKENARLQDIVEKQRAALEQCCDLIGKLPEKNNTGKLWLKIKEALSLTATEKDVE